MVRVGVGKGDYVLDMECNAAKQGLGQWGMSYKYVGPFLGQYVLVEQADDHDLHNWLLRRLYFLNLAGLVLTVVVALIVVWASSKGSVGRKDTEEVNVSTSTGLPSHMLMSRDADFSLLTAGIDRGYSSFEAAWRALSQMAEGPVAFRHFRRFANQLRPVMEPTSVWLIFSQLDQNSDLQITRAEFLGGLGQVVAPPPLRATTTGATRARTVTTSHSSAEEAGKVTSTESLEAQDLAALRFHLSSFRVALVNRHGSVDRSRAELFKDSTEVDFPAFAIFAAALRPPLSRSQAWLVFSFLDRDSDLAVQEGEFADCMAVAES